MERGEVRAMEFEDWLMATGWVCVVIGTGMIYIPAGVIALGLGLIGFSLLIARKKAEDGAVEQPVQR